MDNYRNALKESGADNGLFITKYESMIHTFIAYDPDQSGDRDCYAPFIEGHSMLNRVRDSLLMKL